MAGRHVCDLVASHMSRVTARGLWICTTWQDPAFDRFQSNTEAARSFECDWILARQDSVYPKNYRAAGEHSVRPVLLRNHPMYTVNVTARHIRDRER